MKITTSTRGNSIILENNQYAAFCELVETHRIRLYRFILRHVVNADDTADITQQTFVEAFRSLENFRGESALSTWLYGIALNLVRAYLMRSPQRLHHFESEDILLDVTSTEVEPNEQTSLTETVSAVQQYFEALSLEMRTVLEMVTIDEMSYGEVANTLHIPVGTVRSRMSRARTQLKLALKNAGVETF